jgi:serine/threonine protein kinase
MLQSSATRTTRSLGDFELLQTIGRGANATVYKARHKPTGKIAAVKVLARHLGLDPIALERFKREFTLIRQLQHRHLVRAIAFAERQGIRYLVAEYVPGLNLEQRLRQTGPLPVEDVAAIFVQIADGLRHLHINNLLHRDLKPSNVFLTDQNIAKLGDFGLLKELDNDAPITQTQQSLGTMEFGAPEQFEDAKRVDRRCDVFSLAATMYTALTGMFPFGNAGPMQTLQRKLLGQFVPLRLLLPMLDPAIDQLLSRCLDPDPRRRPADCNEFLDVLGHFFPEPESASSTIIDTPDPDPLPRDRKERRATLRYTVDLNATFVPFHQNVRGRWEATILDVSSLGVRLQTTCPVDVNSVMHVTFGNRALSELALVKWVQAGAGNTHIVGCSFVRPLACKDLEEIFTSAPTKFKEAAVKSA